MPPTSADLLDEAIFSLEQLARECFLLVSAFSGHAASDEWFEIRSAVRHKIAACVSGLVATHLPDRDNTGAPDGSYVFIADKRFRGIQGDLQRTEADLGRDELLAYHEYTERYGTLAAEGRLVNSDEQKFFMPVAFWDYNLYEKPLDGLGLEISGFSKWTENGFLYCFGPGASSPLPVYGLHISPDSPRNDFDAGVLHVGFRDAANITPANLNQYVADCFSRHRCSFLTEDARGEFTFMLAPRLPIVSGGGEAGRKKVAELLFSTLFFSNFADVETADWRASIQEIAHGPHVEAKLANRVQALCDRYVAQAKDARAASSPFLVFRHYYPFLLNPGLSFGVTSGSRASALGTLNLYTNVELPAVLLGLMRKYLESIYQLLRSVEEWEMGKIRGAQEQLGNYSHEVTNVTRWIHTQLVQPLSNPFSLVTSQAESSAGWLTPLGLANLSAEVPGPVAAKLGFVASMELFEAAQSQMLLWAGAKNCLRDFGIGVTADGRAPFVPSLEQVVLMAKKVSSMRGADNFKIGSLSELRALSSYYESAESVARHSISCESCPSELSWVLPSEDAAQRSPERVQAAFLRAAMAILTNAFSHAKGREVHVFVKIRSTPELTLMFGCRNAWDGSRGSEGGTQATLTSCVRAFDHRWTKRVAFGPVGKEWIARFEVPLVADGVRWLDLGRDQYA